MTPRERAEACLADEAKLNAAPIGSDERDDFVYAQARKAPALARDLIAAEEREARMAKVVEAARALTRWNMNRLIVRGDAGDGVCSDARALAEALAALDAATEVE